MKEKIDTKIVIVGICAITILEAIALFNGINGILLTTVIAILAAAIGIAIPKSKVLK